MAPRVRWAFVFALSAWSLACKEKQALTVPVDAALALHEEVVHVPLRAPGDGGETTFLLETTLYLPDGAGPFPAVVINHGSPRSAEERRARGRETLLAQSRWFLQRGFAVAIPMRRGYAHSDGEYAEAFGECQSPDYVRAGLETARDQRAALEYLAKQATIDTHRLILVGHSAGGFGALALISQGAPGVVAVLNFAAGRGSRGPNENCSVPRLVDAMAKWGETAKVPSLWIYAEGDLFFSPDLARQMFENYTRHGANARLEILPPFGKEDGHLLFWSEAGIPIWAPVVERYLTELGLLPR
jgi:dienelactone hydrolase